jgi:hypothetical protein
MTRAEALAAPDKESCAESYADAQQLRSSHQLLAARKRLVLCAQASCPVYVRSDCERWLTEVDHDLPTIVVRVRDAHGVDVVDARILVDGRLVSSRVDGRAFPLDAGEHVVRIEREARAPFERSIVAAEGEKTSLVEIVLPADAAPIADSSATPPSDAGAAPSPAPSRVPTGVFVLGGVGLVAVGVFGTLAIAGEVDVAHLRSSCFPSCNPSDVDGARRLLQAGDVALGVAVVALAAATTWWLLSRSQAPAAVSRPLRALAIDF